MTTILSGNAKEREQQDVAAGASNRSTSQQPVAWMIRSAAGAKWRVYESQLVAEKDLDHLNASPELTEAQPFRVIPLYEHPLDALAVLAAQAKRVAREDMEMDLIRELDQIRRELGLPVEEPDFLGAIRRLKATSAGADAAQKRKDCRRDFVPKGPDEGTE